MQAFTFIHKNEYGDEEHLTRLTTAGTSSHEGRSDPRHSCRCQQHGRCLQLVQPMPRSAARINNMAEIIRSNNYWSHSLPWHYRPFKNTSKLTYSDSLNPKSPGLQGAI